MIRLSILSLCMLLAGPVAAQNVITLKGTVLSEAEPDRTLISKPSWLRGLHVIGRELPDKRRPQIEVVLPQDWLGKMICARITTISGDYAAMVEFSVPKDVTTRRARLEFDSAYRDVIAAITPANSGVALEKGACIGDTPAPNREFAANFWNEAAEVILNAEGQAELLLNMNIARADELIVRATLERGGEQFLSLRHSCARITTPDALAFNYRCSVFVPPQELTGQSDVQLRFAYERLYRGRRSASREAVILIGAGE